MPEKSTFIKLNRKILNWRWYHDSNTFRVFVHLLLTANVTDHDFERITVHRGQVVTSVARLSENLKISVKSVRTALEHLKSTGEVTVKTTSKYSIITVNKYDEYQRPSNIRANIGANNGQTIGKSVADEGQQYKNDKESNRMIKNERGQTLPPLGQFKNVMLTQSELDELMKKYPSTCDSKLEHLSSYLEITGKQYKNHFAVLLRWLEEDKASKREKVSKPAYDIAELEKINPLDGF